MAKYYRKTLTPGFPHRPAILPLTGLYPMRKHHAFNVMRAQDKLVGTTRRLLCTGGIRGGSGWMTHNQSPARSTTAQIWPKHNVTRTLANGLVRLTPGCFPEVRVIYVLAGPSQIDRGGGNWSEGEARGSLTVNVIYHDADNPGLTTTVQARTYPLEPSTISQGDPNAIPREDNIGAVTGDNGGDFQITRELVIPMEQLLPDDLDPTVQTAALLEQWSGGDAGGTIVEITVSMEGGARIVDFAMYEVPYRIAFEADGIPKPVHFADDGVLSTARNAHVYPLERASEAASDGDPRLGTRHLINVQEFWKHTGPLIFSWHAWEESSDKAVTLTDNDISLSSAAFIRIPDGSLYGDYDATKRGWIIGGGYARRRRQSGTKLVLPTAAVIPVRAAVYAGLDQETTAATVRFQVRESYVDVPITPSEGWHHALGWLRTGISADDLEIVQVAAKTDPTDTMSIRALALWYEQDSLAFGPL